MGWKYIAEPGLGFTADLLLHQSDWDNMAVVLRCEEQQESWDAPQFPLDTRDLDEIKDYYQSEWRYKWNKNLDLRAASAEMERWRTSIDDRRELALATEFPETLRRHPLLEGTLLWDGSRYLRMDFLLNKQEPLSNRYASFIQSLAHLPPSLRFINSQQLELLLEVAKLGVSTIHPQDNTYGSYRCLVCHVIDVWERMVRTRVKEVRMREWEAMEEENRAGTAAVDAEREKERQVLRKAFYVFKQKVGSLRYIDQCMADLQEALVRAVSFLPPHDEVLMMAAERLEKVRAEHTYDGTALCRRCNQAKAGSEFEAPERRWIRAVYEKPGHGDAGETTGGSAEHEEPRWCFSCSKCLYPKCHSCGDVPGHRVTLGFHPSDNLRLHQGRVQGDAAEYCCEKCLYRPCKRCKARMPDKVRKQRAHFQVGDIAWTCSKCIRKQKQREAKQGDILCHACCMERPRQDFDKTKLNSQIRHGHLSRACCKRHEKTLEEAPQQISCATCRMRLPRGSFETVKLLRSIESDALADASCTACVKKASSRSVAKHFACCLCLELKHRSQFTKAMQSKGDSRSGNDVRCLACQRPVCKRCGKRPRTALQKNAPQTKQEVRKFTCTSCKTAVPRRSMKRKRQR